MSLVEIITTDRLSKYLLATGYKADKALALYGWNISISEAFYPLLSASEVCLRNLISSRVIELYGNDWWNHDDFLAQIKKDGKRIVKTAHDKLSRKGAVTSGRMVAELNFGFWVKMLLPRHQEVFWGDFPASFPHLPQEVTYNDLYDRCDKIREFRNRVFHHEPIVNLDVMAEARLLIELIGWLSTDKASWIKPYCRVPAVTRTKPK